MENYAIGTDEVVRTIRHMLVGDMQLNVTPEEIPDNYSLLEGGLALDSILIAELITRIEDHFGLQLGDRVLRTDLFNNISLLADFVANEHLATQFAGREVRSKGAQC